MKIDVEVMFFAGVIASVVIIAVCATVGTMHYRDTTVEYAKAGLQECVSTGMADTVWQRDCE